MTDHYLTLNIPRDAATDSIVRAWREAASLHHPDRGGDAQKFHAAREAFNTLMDRQKRAAHDASLKAPTGGIQGSISNDDYGEMQKFAGTWARDPHNCPCCDGTREVRVAANGFWNRKPCPACSEGS